MNDRDTQDVLILLALALASATTWSTLLMHMMM